MEKRDILVLGATGFTGRLILKYLNSHPTRHSFSLGLAGRSAEKLQQLVAQFQLQDVPVHQLDLQNVDQVRSLVGTYRIVVTAVGPFWRYGKVVAQVCAELGTHYVDTTGEPHFIQYLIEQFDYLATKTGAILIPASGFDSVPSDLTAFYGVSALKRIYGNATPAHTSTSAFAVHGQNISGGTAATMLDIFGGSVPPWMRKRLRDPWLLSPMIGSAPPPKLVYRLPFIDTRGFFFPMSPVNSAVVRRTWGLLQVNSTASQIPYGPKFEYEEFLETSNPVFAAIANLVIALFFVLLAFSSVFRTLLETFILHQPGSGPDESKFDQGWFRVTNITTSDEEHPRAVKAVVRGKGEPGYFLTSVMVGEIALALLPANRERLPAFAKQGGVLTPVSALGQELVERLKATEKFSFDEEQLDITATEPRKTR